MSNIVFLCGAISEDKSYTDKFYEAETLLSRLGYTVLDPIMLPETLGIPGWLRITTAMIKVCDAIVIFDDWVDSVRGRSEVLTALNLDKDILNYKDIVKGKGI